MEAGSGSRASFGLGVTEEEFGKAPRQSRVKPEAQPGQGVTLTGGGRREVLSWLCRAPPPGT